MLKAFFCDSDQTELYAAVNAECATAVYIEEVGEAPDDGYPVELTEAQLDVRYPAFDENETPIEGKTTSIREMLEDHGDKPGWLAGSIQ